MAILNPAKYNPSFLLKQGHLNTLYTYLKRKTPPLNTERKRFKTIDDDFIDIDFIKNGHKKIVLALHGLEGSSMSQYMQGMGNILPTYGFDVALLNHRSCSGEINKTMTMYHSGFTQDIHLLVEKLSADYQDIFIVGFSMGGNMALKYIGDSIYPLNNKLRAIAAVSVPCDLASSSHKLTHWSNYLYEKEFLKTLLVKAKFKMTQFPSHPMFQNLNKIKSLVSFDDYFTGPMHGYSDAADYYDKANSLQFLDKIKKPALLINALDDPFLTPSCFPYEIAKASELLSFMPIKHGGHVGFYMPRSSEIVVDKLVIDFFLQNISS